MVSVITLPFQRVSQKWHDRLNSYLACACSSSSRCALFKVTLSSHVLESYVEFTLSCDASHIEQHPPHTLFLGNMSKIACRMKFKFDMWMLPVIDM